MIGAGGGFRNANACARARRLLVECARALLDSGELPNLSYLSEGATRGVLESTIPFHTGAAWASFTGASPAAHGVYDFMMLRDDGRLSVATQRDLRRTTYYQQLGAQGRRSVLINLPLDQNGCEGRSSSTAG